MTIKTFSIVLALAFASTACNNDAPQQSAAPTEAAPANNPEGAMQTSLPQETPASTLSDPTSLTGAAPATAPAPTGGATGTGKINPPHGQPGHVCGVPVGSSLDGAAAAGGKPAQGTQPAAKSVTVPTPTPSGANATVAPGTNPPHGQPGHVCGTPVGSPLPKQ